MSYGFGDNASHAACASTSRASANGRFGDVSHRLTKWRARAGVAQAERQSLAVWIKGPVFYDTDVALLGGQQGPDWRFGLSLAGDARHAIAGVWSNPA